MTPIDDELRVSLRRQAEGVPPLADPLAGIERRAGRIRRRRVAAAVAGTALAATIVVVGAPAVTHLVTSQPPSGFAGGSSPAPATATPNDRADPTPPANLVRWPTRVAAGPLGTDQSLEAGITREWAAKHGADSRSNKLWGAGLPDGGVAGIWQFWTPGSPSAYTVVGQRQPDGLTFIVMDQVTPMGVKEISSVLAGGAFPHVVVLGPPTTGQISYAADGRRFRPVEHLQGFLGGDGWAVFDRTGPGTSTRLPDLIQVLDGNGRRIYQGELDVGPSGPDI
jgi:hypothetical protein